MGKPKDGYANVHLRLTKSEKEHIENMALNEGIGLGEYIRDSCQKDDVNGKIDEGIHIYGEAEKVLRGKAKEAGVPVITYILMNCNTLSVNRNNGNLEREIRDHYIQYQESKETLNDIEKRAKSMGLTKSEYIRKKALN